VDLVITNQDDIKDGLMWSPNLPQYIHHAYDISLIKVITLWGEYDLKLYFLHVIAVMVVGH
jgi:hypothetical protein